MTSQSQQPVTRTLVASFTVPGEPVSKARARVTSHGTYTPAKTRDAEAHVRKAFWDSSKHPFYQYPVAAPMAMSCTFYLGNKRPRDGDNLWKLCSDALNGVIYIDDKQIIDGDFHKVFVAKADARTEVNIWALEVNA